MSFSVFDLKYYLEVSRTLNISRAAERLGISQPALSQAIKRLENSFGMELLERSRSGIQLTRAGQKLTNSANSLIEDFENIKADIVNDTTDVTGHYTIGCHPSVAQYSVPYFLPELLKKYPKLHIDLRHFDLSRTVAAEVIDFKIDFGIVVNPIRNPDLVITKLCDDIVGFWRSTKLNKLNDIESGEANLFCNDSLSQSKTLLAKLKQNAAKIDRVITSNSLEVIAALTAAGGGIGIIPSKVANQVAAKKIELIKDLPTFKDEIALIYRPTKTKAAKAIIDAIKSAVV